MSPQRDPLVRAHLRRRSTDADAAAITRIVARVDEAIDREPPRRRPMLDWPFRIRRLGLGATAVAAVLVVAVAVPVLAPTLPAGGPRTAVPAAGAPNAGAPVELQVLTAEQLRTLLEPAYVQAYAGRTLVVEDGVRAAAATCPASASDRSDPPCQVGWLSRLSATSYDVAVLRSGSEYAYGAPEAAGASPAVAASPGPLVVRVVNANTVELVGRPETNVGYELVWPVEALRGGVVGFTTYFGNAPSATVIVDGWLTEGRGHPRCVLAPATPPPGFDDFGCGNPSWLTADPVNPGFEAPADGLRAQNGAYTELAKDPARDAGGNAAPRRGLYVVELGIAPDGFDCFLCSDRLLARILARLDTIALP